ncbi:ketosynthase chain-length factor [Nonomuraea fastidiosa]|jgi:act minimal PKS chain-length factor (CLF/KS beta)|uniref:ketosynthase chain-length factor n=1 Tax=Nonomuraea TaxID=83681 RepID=UPI00341564F6
MTATGTFETGVNAAEVHGARRDEAAASGTTVITGIGVVAPNGLGVADYWAATLEGRSGIGRITRFDPARYPVRLAGEISGFVPADHLPGRLIPQTDHMTRLALVAADEALRDAGLRQDAQPEYGVGVVTAAGAGGFEFGHRELEKLWRDGPEHVSAYQSFAWFYAVNTGQISIRHGFRGPSGVLVSDQAGGLDAIAQARRHVRGGLPAVVTGAVDGSLCPWGWVAQVSTGQLSRATDPASAYRPFDADASGFVPGEGGAILIAEDAAAAAARGARVHGRVLGYAATFDRRPRPGAPTSPFGLRRAIELALADAGRAPGDIDVIFADGAGVPDLDRAEAQALAAVFGPRSVPVCVPKTMTGRLCAGAGPLDVAAALLSIRDGLVPPAVHVRPDPGHRLDLVTGEPRPLRVRNALVVARGARGFNSAIVVGAPA